MIILKCVTVTNDLKRNPQHKEDSEKYLFLIPYLEDDSATFIVDPSGDFWPVNEFFAMTRVKDFCVNKDELT